MTDARQTIGKSRLEKAASLVLAVPLDHWIKDAMNSPANANANPLMEAELVPSVRTITGAIHPAILASLAIATPTVPKSDNATEKLGNVPAKREFPVTSAVNATEARRGNCRDANSAAIASTIGTEISKNSTGKPNPCHLWLIVIEKMSSTKP